MSTNVVFCAWNRVVPGREQAAGAHFQEFAEYLTRLQQEQRIDSFEPILLVPGGGNVNGFFLIRAASEKLDALLSTLDWRTHNIRSLLDLEGFLVVRGSGGDIMMENLAIWSKHASRA